MTVPTSSPGYRTSVDPVEEASNRSLGELMRQVSEDLSGLMRQEVSLAKAELRQEGAKAGKAAGLFAGAGLGGVMVLLFLSLALWSGLSNVMDQGWAALIVAVIWATVAGVLYVLAKSNVQQVRGMRQTTGSMQDIPEALKPSWKGADR